LRATANGDSSRHGRSDEHSVERDAARRAARPLRHRHHAPRTQASGRRLHLALHTPPRQLRLLCADSARSGPEHAQTATVARLCKADRLAALFRVARLPPRSNLRASRTAMQSDVPAQPRHRQAGKGGRPRYATHGCRPALAPPVLRGHLCLSRLARVPHRGPPASGSSQSCTEASSTPPTRPSGSSAAATRSTSFPTRPSSMPQTATHTTPCCCPHAFPPSEAASRACRPLCCCSGSSLAWARSGPGSSTSTAPSCCSRCSSRPRGAGSPACSSALLSTSPRPGSGRPWRTLQRPSSAWSRAGVWPKWTLL